MIKGKVILICPLNWGLGHVTRCLPIIKKMNCLGAEVVLGSSGKSLELLHKLFPSNKIFELPDYGINYQRWGRLDLKNFVFCSKIDEGYQK